MGLKWAGAELDSTQARKYTLWTLAAAARGYPLLWEPSAPKPGLKKDYEVAKKAGSKRASKKKAAGKPKARKAKLEKVQPATPREAAGLLAKLIKTKGARRGKARKSPLSKQEIKELRQILLDKRRALLGDMANIEDQAIGKNRQEGTGDLSNMPTHPADIGSDNYEHEFTLGLLESERALLEEIDQALERIKNKTYGLCVATGNPIGIPRLRARPWAKYCIEYARMVEKGLVRPNEENEEEQAEEEAEEAVEEAADDEGED